MSVIGIDDLKPPQNNGTLIFRLTDKQWFWAPHVGATCWVRFDTKEDALELYRGAYQATVVQEGITDGDNSKEGATGQASGAADVPTTSIKDNTQTWTVDEWVGARMYLHRWQDGSIEYATVLSNTADTLVGAPNTFNGVVDDAWTGASPVQYDYYALLQTVNDNASFRIRWKTLKLGLANIRKLKQFIELTFRTYATGSLTLAWVVDGKRSGSFSFDLSQGDRYWGRDYFGASDVEPGAGTLLWQGIDETILQQNFDDSAEGQFIEFEIELETAERFEITMLAMTYLMHLGDRWQ